MIYSSLHVLKEGFGLVMDKSLEPDVVKKLTGVLAACGKIIGFHDFKTRAGRVPHVDFHIVVRPDGREHLLDRFLDHKGWHRHVTLELSHFMSLLAILPQSDLIVTVPDDIAQAVGRHIPLTLIDLPFRPLRIEVQQFWHRRLHQDPANRWLRSVFHDVHRRDATGQA